MNIDNNKKLALVGVHGTGKSTICKNAFNKVYCNKMMEAGIDFPFEIIPEQFREVVENTPNFTKQTEEITIATYAKQLYLENLYIAQGKNILCDRSVLDTFVYYNYFNNLNQLTIVAALCAMQAIKHTINTYSKIYLIEPSNREIENDGFRMTDKKQQLEVHKLFLEYFKDFPNVEIVNQEEAHKEEFINKVVSEFVL